MSERTVEPIVETLFEYQKRSGKTQQFIAEKAGISCSQLHNWRCKGQNPRHGLLEACFNVMGYTLQPVPLEEIEQDNT